MSTQPVILVEDSDFEISAATQMQSHLGAPVHLVRDYGSLLRTVDELAEGPDLRKPVIVLDPGLPDICRLETIRRALDDLGPQSLIIQWTASRSVAAHVGALIDGARASLAKTNTAARLASVVQRVGADRFSCEPGQAQWFLDMLQLVQEQNADHKSTVWAWTEIANIPEDEWFDAQRARLTSVAEGGELPANDAWFADLLKWVRRWWLQPKQRKVMAAVIISPTRTAAAPLVGISANTVHSHMGKIGGRLVPYKHLSTTPAGEKDAQWAPRVLSELHSPCDLSLDDHLRMFSATTTDPTTKDEAHRPSAIDDASAGD